MEETYYLIYNCYGLNFKVGTAEEMENERDKIIEKAKGKAGKDARKLEFYFICKKKEFLSLISQMMA